MYDSRGVIKSKAGKAAALPKFSDTLTLSQSGRLCPPIDFTLPYLKISVIMPLYAPEIIKDMYKRLDPIDY